MMILCPSMTESKTKNEKKGVGQSNISVYKVNDLFLHLLSMREGWVV